MTARGDVAVLLVNWNSSQDVLRTVRTITLEYPQVRAIVVDNASALADREALAALELDGAIVDRLPENRGYAAGVNRGLRRARTLGSTWVWLMNPDALPYPGCLDTLLSASTGAVVLSPRQLTSTRPLDESATQYVSAAHRVDARWEHELCPGCAAGTHDVDVVTGTGLLVHVDAAHRAGYLAESFFHYKEEFEFTERMAQCGAVRYVCQARLWHQRGGSLSTTSPTADYYRVRNELLYLAMRSTGPWRLRGRAWRWSLRSLGSALRARPEARRAILLGLAHGIAGRSGRWK